MIHDKPYPAAPATRRPSFATLSSERLAEIAASGGLATYEKYGQAWMQEIGARGGRAGTGDAKRRHVTWHWQWWIKAR